MSNISPPASNLLYLPTSVPNTLVPTNVVNGVTGVASTVNSFLSSVVGSIPQVPQYFFTVPFANNQPVLYKLEIITSPNNGPFIAGASLPPFIFPLTPVNVTKQSISLTNYYDVAGPPGGAFFGVQRIIDQYGLTPPIITISGTTGFQFHSLDQFQWSGKASFALLVQYIQTYISLLTQATQSNQQGFIPRLQFTDGFTGEVFLVVPLSQQVYSMDVSRPIIQTYNLQFLAQQTAIANPIGLAQQDLLAQVFVETSAILAAGFLSWWNSILDGVLPGTIV